MGRLAHLRPATTEEVETIICKSRRTAPGPDGLPDSMWKSAGRAAARTLRDLTSAFADGVKMPHIFNESWLALAEGDGGGRPRRRVHQRGLRCQAMGAGTNTDAKTVAAVLARGMRPIVSKEAHPTQRGFVAGRELTTNVMELDACAHSVAQQRPCRRLACHPLLRHGDCLH